MIGQKLTQTGADVIAAKLADAGFRHVFGMPGGEVLALLEALTEAGLNFTLSKHENAGGFMGEGAWHATGAPSVLLATLGPGVANAVNVVANAYQDRVPMIFLTGCVDAAESESYTHQVFDHQALLRPVVKASFSARPGALSTMMDKALAIALEGQPGPVHIDVPITVAEGQTPEAPVLRGSEAYRPAQFTAEEAALAQAQEMFAKAERPIVLAGVDAVNEGAGPALTAFCQGFQIPLITTYKGKGLLDESDPLALGGAGLSPKADAHLLPLLAQSDCILLCGYDPIEMRINWRNPWPAEAPVIEITPVLRTHGMHEVALSLRSAVAPALENLTSSRDAQSPSWACGSWQATKVRLNAEFRAEDTGWGPATVFHTLRQCLPAETVATADSGAHRILLSQIWLCPAPRTLLQSSALCTMACSLPLAIGHRHADPQAAPVIAFIGDAGLEMCLGELSTLRDLGIPVIVCVLVDRSLSLIELKQRSSGRKNVGVDFPETDFPAVARAYGGHGIWVENTVALTAEADAALKRPGFTLLACRIPERAYDGRF
ncbi:thiamine pyrophosphate-binding protein [Roseibium sp. CAU 1637]|uniref:Thiamine pyrophosphate-binding protein n=1 Tax=Roseibium limicola TaxID=2816037 RepID=A0A939ES13_9HYPH|nr:thiamine pyrophosphate-binding protein [Roseibium limicola]MBO0346533.1 thiamine pyrophosphate-binding protein [Roseibium limicola]